MADIIALIPAAGVGARAQTDADSTPKQYRMIGSRSMLAHTAHALVCHPLITHIYIGVTVGDEWITEQNLPPSARILRSGGQTRAATVLNTLQALPHQEDSWVLVHDAARPGVPLDCVDALIQHCLKADCGGILALPVGDTVKRAESHKQGLVQIQTTIAREALWLAQTPQMFRLRDLREALARALAQGLVITDEASAMELAGYHPLLVRGHWRNLKVTWPEDFEFIEPLLVKHHKHPYGE